MSSNSSTAVSDARPARITRLSDTEWQATAGGLLLGEADASPRADGRLFLSVDTWEEALFEPLARAVLAELPGPLHTLVDAADDTSLDRWQRLGFTVARRELTFAVPTDPQLTGLGPVRPPIGVTVLPLGEAALAPLRELDGAVRAEVAAGPGWETMPAEVIPLPPGDTVADPARYAVATDGDRYVGLLRLAPVPRRPRIGLLAVRAGHQRRGIARALLARVLGDLHTAGVTTASAEVTATNQAAVALFEAIGARRTGSVLELTRP
ncbi:GNAT family N-acetyltransferase [Kitasatospora sp. NPDC002227]|uniref:GNAT family N-acetyltransferase n=1 Tax=Kitasatospora sp. NPDC002227 TaxID=3154773 RepID=UPI00332341B5